MFHVIQSLLFKLTSGHIVNITGYLIFFCVQNPRGVAMLSYRNHRKCDNKTLIIVHFARCVGRNVRVCWGAVLWHTCRAKHVKSGAGYCISRGQPCKNNHVYHMQGSTQTSHSLLWVNTLTHTVTLKMSMVLLQKNTLTCKKMLFCLRLQFPLLFVPQLLSLFPVWCCQLEFRMKWMHLKHVWVSIWTMEDKINGPDMFVLVAAFCFGDTFIRAVRVCVDA